MYLHSTSKIKILRMSRVELFQDSPATLLRWATSSTPKIIRRKKQKAHDPYCSPEQHFPTVKIRIRLPKYTHYLFIYLQPIRVKQNTNTFIQRKTTYKSLTNNPNPCTCSSYSDVDLISHFLWLFYKVFNC